MNVKITAEDEQRVEFTLSDTNHYFANLLRRFAMSYVPVMAIDSITVYENNSSSFDEYLANRIGLVPLKAPPNYNPKGGFSLLSLDKQGEGVVYSSDLKSQDSKVKVAIPNIPLIKLLEHQSLRIEAKAVPGIGVQSAKFQCSVSAYDIVKDGSFSFFTESFSQLPPRAVLSEACGLIEEKCKEFTGALSELK